MEINLIAAIARNGVIGFDGKIPWHISEDLKRFKDITSGHTVIMGRKTFESIGKALPDRRNIVLSATRKSIVGCEVCSSVDQALALCKDAEKVFIIGGGEIYDQTLSMADRLLLTHVDKEVKGDVHFPRFDKSEWDQVSQEFGKGCLFTEYVRLSQAANPYAKVVQNN